MMMHFRPKTTVVGWPFCSTIFLSAWVAPEEQQIRYYARPTSDNKYLFGFTGPAKVIQPGDIGVWSADFYAGPKDQIELEEISEHPQLDGRLWFSLVDSHTAVQSLDLLS